MNRTTISLLTMGAILLAALPPAAHAADEQPWTYLNDLEDVPPGPPPQDLLVLNGDFEIKRLDGNQLLELPGEPLNSFGILFGPDDGRTTACSARIWGNVTGKRFPEFGIGLFGAGGYRLWLMPAVGELQIVFRDEAQVAIPYTWSAGAWTTLRFQATRTADGQWTLQGKAWQHGKPEPAEWMIQLDITANPTPGRASICGTPYSGKPIRFDDLMAGQAR